MVGGVRICEAIAVWFLFFMSTSDAFAAEAAGNTNNEVPRLGPSDPNKNLPTFKLGETIRLEEMGPIIINTDGTTRVIDNWDGLSEGEKKVTWRRISKRNEERRKVLLQQQEELLKQQEQQEQQEAEEKAEEL